MAKKIEQLPAPEPGAYDPKPAAPIGFWLVEKPTYHVHLLRHDVIKDKPAMLAFVGPFSECWAFVQALDTVKPHRVGPQMMDLLTSPYLLSLTRSDGKGLGFRISSATGNKRTELILPAEPEATAG